jgi:adenine-specific DNA-methyltransferase
MVGRQGYAIATVSSFNGVMIGYRVWQEFMARGAPRWDMTGDGGPEFASFRKRVLQLAEVLVVDLIEKRSDVFLDTIQDACFVVLRRRAEALAEPHASTAGSGVFRRDGEFFSKGVARIEANVMPWRLPGIELPRSSTLIDWEYRATVGYLVANR